MLSLSPATRIFVAWQPVDTRAGFDRIYARVEARLNQDLGVAICSCLPKRVTSCPCALFS